MMPSRTSGAPDIVGINLVLWVLLLPLFSLSSNSDSERGSFRMVSSGGTFGYGGGWWVDSEGGSCWVDSWPPPLEAVWPRGPDVKPSASCISALNGRTSCSDGSLVSPTRLRIGNTRSILKSVEGRKTTAFGESGSGPVIARHLWQDVARYRHAGQMRVP